MDAAPPPRYVRLDGIEHALRRPDTMIGAVTPVQRTEWVLSSNGAAGAERLERREVKASPGLLKIFDEILVNAADNAVRDGGATTRIDVEVDRATGAVRISNNGATLPLGEHETEGMRVPELVFGHLMSGENFSDDQRRLVGGRNGLGSKLANIFSTRFEVEIVGDDGGRRRQYTQAWSNNMRAVTPPVLRASKKQTRTTICFQPELARFGLSAPLDADTVGLMRRRAYDVAGCLGKGVSVYFDGAKIQIPTFAHYARLAAPEALVAELGPRWTVGVAAADDDAAALQHMSFVNCVATPKGGTHVDLVADAVARSLKKALAKRLGGNIRPKHIKQLLLIHVRAQIENPAFSSQTKEELTTEAKDFGSAPDWEGKAGQAFLGRLARGKVGEAILAWAQRKAAAADARELSRVGASARRSTVRVPKLEDASWAGGPKSAQCALILTEGDSAAALAIAGLTVVGRQAFGVFPLKGKPLNVRGASTQAIAKNAEIQHIVQILGLGSPGTCYATAQQRRPLRYGKVIIMADQDVDGSHIKGLLVNLFASFWPSLLAQNYLKQFITPIVKAKLRARTETFYTLAELKAWQDATADSDRWSLKYYKGLGTSTSAEAREYFRSLERHCIGFHHTGAACDDRIDLAFSKKRAADRKDWLADFDDGGVAADYDTSSVSYADFVDRELVCFSQYDNQRSLPSAIDGLKPSQRKVLFACFKRNLTGEMKVAQLAGYVAEHSAYHHGEASLNATIVNMAQDYCGATNLNLLAPVGQFGTRAYGGKDAASPRYIFTQLMPVARLLFPAVDDALLPQQEDDGQPIEPKWYVPVIPLALVNGADGIGTGWSTFAPPHDPLDVLRLVRARLGSGEEEENEALTPRWRGFRGTVRVDGTTVHTRGVCAATAPKTYEVTELPPRYWTNSFKLHLESLAEAGTISSFENLSDDVHVRVVVHGLDGDPFETLKLDAKFSTGNVHLWDRAGRITKFDSALQILEEWFPVRLALYAERRQVLIEAARREASAAAEKARFIDLVRSGDVDLRAATATVEARLRELGFAEVASLLGMKLSSLTHDNAEALRRAAARASEELEALKGRSAARMWADDLDALEQAIDAPAEPAPKRART